METAHSLGLSLRRFHGWEPRETTRVTVRDDEGRPTEWVTTREPEWDDDERDIMRARQHIEAHRCSQCGGDLDEFLTDEPPVIDNPGYGFSVGSVWCRKCVAMAKWRRMHKKTDERNEDTDLDEFPEVRRLVAVRKDIPTTD